jgi:response regulator RpfG family c-di-GMP phosphodiesterase
MSSILLVYERDQDHAALETLLQSRGHQVTKARTGLEALDLARHDPPHAVVSDVLLPLLDGFALCRRLKEDPATLYLPVFLLSFRVEGPKYEAFAAEVGAQRFFPRGSTLEELATAIDALKAHSDTMRIPALVPELIDRQQHDRRRVADLERQLRELQYTNKLLAAAERAARGKIERDAKGRADVAATESDKARELQQRIDELEQQQQALTAAESDKARELQQRVRELEERLRELSAAESQARGAAEESRAGLARVAVLEARLEELQSSRARAQAIAADAERAFGAQPLPTLLFDMETHEIRAASDSAAALLGIAPQALPGRSLADVLPGCVPGDNRASPADVEVVRPDGSRAVFALHRTSVSYAGRACWLTSLVDVSAERSVREEQRLAQARATALEASPVATCIVDGQGQVTHMNPAFRALLSIAAGRSGALALREFEAGEAGASGAADQAAGDGVPRRARWRRADGSQFDAEVSSAAPPELAGERIVTVRDVTDLLRAEHRAGREQRLHEGLLDLAQHTHTLTETEVPVRALDLARQITGSERGYVFLATSDATHLELAARSPAGGDAGQALPVRWRGQPPAESALWECATSQRVSERLAAEGTGVLRQAGLPGTLARQLATPIVDGGRLAGVLLLADKPEPYREEDRAHTARVADALWKALRRRRSDAEIVSAMDHMERVMLGAIEAIGALSEAQDGCKTGRARRVAELAAGIGTGMGLPGHSVRGLRVIGQLIDVGMLHIPREILWRTAPLSAAEFELVRTHAERGYESLRHIDFPWPVAEAVRQHHERLDGSGYPRGLKGDQILLEARIAAVADAVEAMLSQRPQRPALSMAACVDELQAQSGRRYDAAVVRACVRLLRERQEPEPQAGKRIA